MVNVRAYMEYSQRMGIQQPIAFHHFELGYQGVVDTVEVQQYDRAFLVGEIEI